MRNRKTNLPNVEVVKRLFWYEPIHGLLFWNDRPLSDFQDKRSADIWNSKFAGKLAGSDSPHGYTLVSLPGGGKTGAHRIVWLLAYGEWPSRQIDHINGDRDDNRLTNLRLATPSENRQNQKLHRDSRTGFKGVSLDKRRNKYMARITFGGRQRSLGCFETAELAHAAYVAAARKHFGEFARLQ